MCHPPRNALFLALLFLLTLTTAQKLECRGRLENRLIKTSVIVRGGSCVLNNVKITGDVIVKNKGTLTTLNNVNILGCVHAFQSHKLNLWGVLTVKGGVSVMDSGDAVFLSAQSRVGAVSLIHVPKFFGLGSMASVSSINSGPLMVHGATIRHGGVFRRGGWGLTEVCGATIEGGISMSNVKGDLYVEKRRNCAANTIDGSIYVHKGIGNVVVSAADFTATDIIVVEQKGFVNVRKVTISDVTVARLTGSVHLDSVFADSDAAISRVTGTVSVLRSKFEGDVNVGNNNIVNLHDNNFGLEVVTVYSNWGWVAVARNKKFSISLTENKSGVAFNNNDVRVATITKNRKAVNAYGNRAQLLTCYGNLAAPKGNWNNVFLPSPGQCARLRTSSTGFSRNLLS